MLQDKTDITDVEFKEVVEQPPVQDRPMSIPETVTFLLEEAGVEDPKAWLEGLNPVALESADLNMQRFLINRHWLGLFLALPKEEIAKSTNARGCLVNGKWELSDWVQRFKKVVIPCAIEQGLFKKID